MMMMMMIIIMEGLSLVDSSGKGRPQEAVGDALASQQSINAMHCKQMQSFAALQTSGLQITNGVQCKHVKLKFSQVHWIKGKCTSVRCNKIHCTKARIAQE